ncbi:chitinase [Aquabacterium sp.]|uniref:chitinase n=1 Tax=Aquabacterium sp. TaxID=1872578 RepID=UPI002B57E1B0|nr:chitinase [Aquabacterium sp.]HSW06539.1 chitinase [Aquabacterium sp.]
MPTRAQFDRLFPERIAFYSYEGFVAALAATPGLAASGSAQLRRQEMAAFLAQIAHESDQLRAVREYERANWDHYCRRDPGESCAPGKQYYGRGPIQLSWNYQYLAAGRALGIDLWADPDRVAGDATVAWQTALWYWMTQIGPGRMTAHEAMLRGEGFGETTRSINGALECDKPGDAAIQRKLERRIGFYRQAAELFGAPPGERLAC